MREEGVVDAAFIYNDPAMPTCLVGGQRLTGISYLDLHSYAIDGVSDCIIRALRYALTTGVETGFVIFKADGTDTEQHTLLAKGDAKLCQDAGDLRLGGNMYVTLPTTQPADIELANGQAVFWIQE